jgi:hypothetical protein
VLLCSRAVLHLRSRSIHKSKSLDLMSCSKECGSTRRRGTLGIVLARARVRALLIERAEAGNENGIGKLCSNAGGTDTDVQLCWCRIGTSLSGSGNSTFAGSRILSVARHRTGASEPQHLGLHPHSHSIEIIQLRVWHMPGEQAVSPSAC